ncbi:hypothetical protein L7F22_002105 [Adiantum nelumboides]|nr:hypothetical protein [Adiantum nelumboides]
MDRIQSVSQGVCICNQREHWIGTHDPPSTLQQGGKPIGKGLQSARFLVEAIDKVVSRLVQQRFCLQEVIWDARKMKFLHYDEIAQHYCSFAIKALSKDMYAVKDVGYEGLDSRAIELLNWLCTRAQGDTPFNAWIQEALCTFLLDVE